MTTRDEKARRRKIVRDLRAREDAAAEAKRPLPKAVLRTLLAHLEGALLARGPDGKIVTRCDHTPAHTRAYLTSLDLWDDSLPDWLGMYGGFCDCEVMYNVFDYWTATRLAE